ncbi:MAG: undecaprenyl-diphosphate phosphatase [bacterium]
MHIFQTIILGIVEGVTEFLPISSTGHMILASHVLGISETDFVKSFEIFIQLGAILAVVALYWKKLLMNKKIFLRVCVAFLPTAVIGLVLYKLVKTYLLGNISVVLWSLLLGGIFLIGFEYFRKGKISHTNEIENISYKQAFIVGLFQSIAIIPGVSRSAATIVGGLALGISREAIVEFSFMLAVPTMVAATGLDLIKSGHAFNGGQIELLAIGFLTAFISAFFAIKFLLNYVKNHTFTSFGVYRILIALVFFFAVL